MMKMYFSTDSSAGDGGVADTAATIFTRWNGQRKKPKQRHNQRPGLAGKPLKQEQECRYTDVHAAG